MRFRLPRISILGAGWLAAALLVFGGSSTSGPLRAQTTPLPPPSPNDEFFSDTTLHDIRLVINSRDWEKLKANYLLNTPYPCTLYWRDQIVRNVGIRSRGLGSRSPTKPGLRVDFDEYATKQEFLGLKSVVLDNLTQDPSNIRERLAMLMFQRLGLPAPRETHARLFINGTYVGLYAIVESIDKAFLKRVFGINEFGTVENDGYLFEYRYQLNSPPYYLTYLGSDLAPYVPLFEPKTHETASKETLYRPIETMIRIINQAPSALFTSQLAPYLDLLLFMQHVAVETFIAENDGLLGYWGLNNFYYYRFEKKTLSQFLAWDKDNAFVAVEYPLFQGAAENALMRRALAVPALREAYLDSLLAATDSASAAPEPPTVPEVIRRVDEPTPPGWLELEVEKEYEQIRTAARADRIKPWTNEEFESNIGLLRHFARYRSSYVRCEVEKLRGLRPPQADCAVPPFVQ